MKRLRITVYGRVQRVGYRDRVAETARKIGITGTVRNLEDEVTVEIIVEGEENKLKEFVKLINIKDLPIDVEKIDSKEEKATGEFKYFKIKRGEPNEELGERIDVAGNLLYNMDKKLGSIDKKQDKMLEKQDQTNQKLGEVNTDLGTKLDNVSGKLDTFNHSTQQRFDHLDVKYGKVSEKLGSIDNHLKELVDILRTFKPK